MADKQPAKKRLVKNPETFRERAVKATEDSDKPKRAARLRAATSKVTAPVLQPAAKVSSRVFASRPFVILRKILRFVGKILLPAYFRNSWHELRLVTWPNWKQSRQLTFAVLVFAIAFGALIAIVDYGLDKIFRDVLLK